MLFIIKMSNYNIISRQNYGLVKGAQIMPRKGENIYKRKDGRWEGRFRKYRDANGKIKYGYVYARSYTEVKIKLNKIKQEITIPAESGTADIIVRTFSEVVKEWITYKTPLLKESSVAKYTNIINLHLLPFFHEQTMQIPSMDAAKKKTLYEYYKNAGYKLKVYDYPTMYAAGGKRHLREFDIEELLFRKPLVVSDERTNAYYKGKVVLITGGGGSIGSELCRQLAKMNPKKIIILDIYENGAYDVQQELKIAYGNKLDLQIEICSITHRKALERVFEKYHPQIIINAAAHKHVPLMEHNCVEAIYNNVFGTQNLVELCEEYGAERFMMVSTDKAVNPTNVMGATKRMCEMIVQSASTHGKVKYSATRFGNVLGSAGSVIPLFKRQIANGGPVTVTDKRSIRYFMTIPEASQLVLQSGAIANNGELFVLDMGKPVKIMDLAENMIRLSGVQGIEIIETGLRPGEKLYEELLVKTEELDKTDNSLIFIERDTALSKEEIYRKIDVLRNACDTGDDLIAKEALRSVVPTFKTPEEVNKEIA